MSTATLVSVSEYLATCYRPDREYVDGQLLERNLGELDHSRLQKRIIAYSIRNWEPLHFEALPELRVQVKPNRFRVPDISVVRGDPGEQILTRPPFLCVEILSPEDSMTSMQERIDDYVQFGVENIWILDPRRRKAFWVDGSGIHEVIDGVLRGVGAPFSMELAPLWPVLTPGEAFLPVTDTAD